MYFITPPTMSRSISLVAQSKKDKSSSYGPIRKERSSYRLRSDSTPSSEWVKAYENIQTLAESLKQGKVNVSTEEKKLPLPIISLQNQDPNHALFWMNRYFNSKKESIDSIKELDDSINKTLGTWKPLKVTLQQAKILYDMILGDQTPAEIQMEMASHQVSLYNLKSKMFTIPHSDNTDYNRHFELFLVMISPIIQEFCGPKGSGALKNWDQITDNDIHTDIAFYTSEYNTGDASLKEYHREMLSLWKSVKKAKSRVFNPNEILVLCFYNEDGEHVEYGENDPNQATKTEEEVVDEYDDLYSTIHVTSFKLIQGIQIWFRTVKFGPTGLEGNHLQDHPKDTLDEDTRDFFDPSTQSDILGGPNWVSLHQSTRDEEDFDYDDVIKSGLFQCILFGDLIIG